MDINLENFKGSLSNEERSQKKNGIKKEIEKTVIFTEHGEKITIAVEHTVHDRITLCLYDELTS